MIDLHMHSRYSNDGEFTPAELVEKCASAGVRTMSVTDHNCVRANGEARKTADQKGIRYIPGVEIDCVFRNTNFHMLGYDIDYRSNDFAEIEKDIEDQSLRASLEMLSKTQALGFQITENDMLEASKEHYRPMQWTGEMFAEILLTKPEYRDHPILRNYRPGGARSDNPYTNFYWDYYSPGKFCYGRIDYHPMRKVIDLIHQNHGIAVLAHPGMNLKGNESLLPSIAALGIDGIEAFSSYHTQEQAEYYYRQAVEMGKLATCGSDFHGKVKPAISIGGVNCPPGYDRSKLDESLSAVFSPASAESAAPPQNK